MNQIGIVLSHMMRHGGITAEVARKKYGIQKLSARIREMRLLGLDICYISGMYVIDGVQRKRRTTNKPIGEDDLFPEYENE